MRRHGVALGGPLEAASGAVKVPVSTAEGLVGTNGWRLISVGRPMWSENMMGDAGGKQGVALVVSRGRSIQCWQSSGFDAKANGLKAAALDLFS